MQINQLSVSWIFAFVWFMFFSAQAQQIRITEIMYNPPESGVDSLEYIELYNASDKAINLAGFGLIGVNHTFDSLQLAPRDYVVIAKDSSSMRKVFGVSVLQWGSGTLNNQGELVAVLDTVGNIVDQVTYQAVAPWPEEANGGGASIEICDSTTNNDLPANWFASVDSTEVLIEGNRLSGSPARGIFCGDATAPELLAINVLADTLIEIAWSEPLDSQSVDTLWLSFMPDLLIDSIQIIGSMEDTLKIITQDPLTPCVLYELSLAGISDTATNLIDTIKIADIGFCPPDTSGPVLVYAQLDSTQTVILAFDEPVDTSQSDKQNFTFIVSEDSSAIIPEIDTLIFNSGNDTLTLKLDRAVSICTNYALIYTVTDTAGNIQIDTTDSSLEFCPPTSELIITEIMYDPPEAGFDFLEFIEVYNNGPASQDLALITFEGIQVDLSGRTLSAGAFLVLVSDSASFSQIYDYSNVVEWNQGAFLSNEGERIAILDTAGVVLDEVNYSAGLPWPVGASGGGQSIILCDLEQDNDTASNWSVSREFTDILINGVDVSGSPGRLESCLTQPSENDTIPPQVGRILLKEDQVIIPFDESILVPSLGEEIILSGFAAQSLTVSDRLDTVFIQLSGIPGSCVFINISIQNISDTLGNMLTDTVRATLNTACDTQAPLIISEIFYDAPTNDTLEFIEIYHGGLSPVNLRGFRLDGAIKYTFPDTLLQPGSYIVVARNTASFEAIFEFDVLEWSLGGLSDNGDQIILENPNNTTIDLVVFKASAPWPENPDNTISSLELTSGLLNNSLPQSWQRSRNFIGYYPDDTLYATPGMPSFGSQPVNAALGDTTVCGQTIFTANAGNPGSEFLWSTGETMQLTTLTQSGSYQVTINNGVNLDSIEFQLQLVSDLFPTFSVPDTACLDSVVVFASDTDGATSWSWDFGNGIQSTNSNPSITFDTVGTYTISLQIANDTATCPVITQNVVLESCLITHNSDQIKTPSWNVYPNPVKDIVTLVTDELPATTGSVELVNGMGNVIKKYDWNRAPDLPLKWDLKLLSSGVYYVILTIDAHREAIKIIKVNE